MRTETYTTGRRKELFIILRAENPDALAEGSFKNRIIYDEKNGEFRHYTDEEVTM